MINDLLTEVANSYKVDPKILGILEKNIVEPKKKRKTVNSPYGNYSAVRFNKRNDTLLASSNKWSNIQFNFKNFILDVIPHSAATAGFLSGNLNKVNITLAILAAVGIWKTLLDNTKITLEERDAELIKCIIDVEYKEGHTYNELVHASTKMLFSSKRWDLDSTINKLVELRIITYTADPFFLKLREKVVIKESNHV